ncbi:hypothetical protein AHAS_Ahas01G0145100 [Arachis hypogaea]
MFSVIEFVCFNFSAEEEVAAISEKVPDHKTIARLQLADAKDVLEGIQDVKDLLHILSSTPRHPNLIEHTGEKAKKAKDI